MSDETFEAKRLKATRVCIVTDGSDDLLLRMTDADGDHNFLISPEEFVRLTTSLSQDAQRLSTMPKGGKPS